MDRVPRLLCAALPLLLASSGCQFARSCGWQTSMRPIENCYADCMEHASDLSPIINPDSPLAIDNCRWVRECGPW